MKTWKVLLILFMAALVGFVIFPLNRNIDNLKSENAELSKKREQKIAELKELAPENPKEMVIDPEEAIPPFLNQTELLIDLQNSASLSSVSLPDSWSFSIKNDKDIKLSELRVSFPVKGDSGNIYQFLKLLEKNPRFFKVERLSVSSSLENSIPISEMTVSLYAYSQELLNE